MRLVGDQNLVGARQIAVAGMASFSGEGPPGTHCSGCLHADRKSRRHVKGRLMGKCLKYSALMRGVIGPAFELSMGSCRYFKPGDAQRAAPIFGGPR
jgi:hypothetical protein